MRRFVLSSGEQYIIHDMTETRYDPIGNRKRFYRGGIGKFAIPIPRLPDEGYEKIKVVEGVETVETGYSSISEKIHFT